MASHVDILMESLTSNDFCSYGQQRLADSDSVSLGSNPSPPANFLPPRCVEGRSSKKISKNRTAGSRRGSSASGMGCRKSVGSHYRSVVRSQHALDGRLAPRGERRSQALQKVRWVGSEAGRCALINGAVAAGGFVGDRQSHRLVRA
jgi:hypothetical protein